MLTIAVEMTAKQRSVCGPSFTIDDNQKTGRKGSSSSAYAPKR